MSHSEEVLDALQQSLNEKVQVLEEANAQMATNQDNIAALQAELRRLEAQAEKGELEEQGPVLVMADHDLGRPHGKAERSRHNPSRVEASNSVTIPRIDERYGGGAVLALMGAGLNHPIDQEQPDEGIMWSYDKFGRRTPSEGDT